MNNLVHWREELPLWTVPQ